MDVMQVTDDSISDAYEWLLELGYHVEMDNDGLTIDSRDDMLTAYMSDYIIIVKSKIFVLTEESYLLKYV